MCPCGQLLVYLVLSFADILVLYFGDVVLYSRAWRRLSRGPGGLLLAYMFVGLVLVIGVFASISRGPGGLLLALAYTRRVGWTEGIATRSSWLIAVGIWLCFCTVDPAGAYANFGYFGYLQVTISSISDFGFSGLLWNDLDGM